MSLLLSQLGGGSTTTLIADAGAAALAGHAALFRIALAAQTHNSTETGFSAPFHVGLAGQTASIIHAAPTGRFVLRLISAPAGFAESGPGAGHVSALRADAAAFLPAGPTVPLTARLVHAPAAFLLAGLGIGFLEGESAPAYVGGGAGVRMSGASFSRRRYRDIVRALERERTPAPPKKAERITRRPRAAATPKAPSETYALVARPTQLRLAAVGVSTFIACAAAGAKFSVDRSPNVFRLCVLPAPVRIRIGSGITWLCEICPLEWPVIESLPDLSAWRTSRRKTRRRRKSIDGRIQQVQPVRRGFGREGA